MSQMKYLGFYFLDCTTVLVVIAEHLPAFLLSHNGMRPVYHCI